MTTYSTGNPLGSKDPRDLYDNAENLDAAVNSTDLTWLDRFGRPRVTLNNIENSVPDALQARDEAEAARNQALTAAGMFASTTAALASGDVAVGDIFSVPIDGDVIFYRKDTGPVAVEVGSYSTLLGTQAQILDDTVITIDLQARTLTTPSADGYYGSRHGFGTIDPNQNITLDFAPAPYIRYVYVMPDGTAGCVAIFNKPPSASVVLAFIYNQRLFTLSRAANFRLIREDGLQGDVFGLPENASAVSGTHIANGQRIVLQQNTNVVTTSAEVGLVVFPGGFVEVPGGQSVNYQSAGPEFLFWVCVQRGTGAISVVPSLNPSSRPPTDMIVVALVYGARVYQNGSKSTVFLNRQNEPERSANDPVFAHYAKDQTLTINFAANRVFTSGTDGLAMWPGGFVTIPPNQNQQFASANPNFITYFVANKKTGLVTGVQAYPVDDDFVVLAMTFFGGLYSASQYGNIRAIDATGTPYPTVESSAVRFDPLVQRAVLPTDMYFLPDQPMTLYKGPCFADYNVAIMDQVKFWLNTGGASIVDRFQPIADTVKLIPGQLGAVFDFAYRHQSAADIRYLNTVTKHVAAPSALSGRTVTGLLMGDSLTEVRMAAALRAALVAQNATVNIVGTYASEETLGERTEGRGFWNYRTFVGMCNLVGGNLVTRAPAGPETAKFQNPFLRLATAQDKTDHPSWCFRNTGAVREQSYASNPGGGDFYIFDFAWYRSQHSVPQPDFLTIALSTNDINLDQGAYPTAADRRAQMRLGLEIMVNQIHLDSPNMPIGIIPAPAWSSTVNGDTGFRDEASFWIEQCMRDVEALRSVHPKLYVVPVWPFMSEDLTFPYSSFTSLSPNNKTRVSNITDWVHFDDMGRSQYSSVVGAWVANVV